METVSNEDVMADDENSTGTEGEGAGAKHLTDLPLVTSDSELSFEEALTLTGRRGARLVMPMGEIGVGKTTVMVELWTQLVGVESIGGYRFAGSRTAMAFEERAYLSRMAAGVGRRSTARTHYNENEGLLHLQVARPDGAVQNLLFADYSGERYEHVRDGTAAEIELPWAPRADRILLVVNGAVLGASSTREIETDRAARLLHALEAADLVREEARVAVLVARDDEVDEAAHATAQPRLEALINLAKHFDEDAVLLHVAARPRNGDLPRGFEQLLDWVCSDDPSPVPQPVEMPRGAREIARLREPA